MKKFETVWELPKCDTEAQSEQMLLEKMIPSDLLILKLSQTFNCKNMVSVKPNKTIKWSIPVFGVLPELLYMY